MKILAVEESSLSAHTFFAFRNDSLETVLAPLDVDVRQAVQSYFADKDDLAELGCVRSLHLVLEGKPVTVLVAGLGEQDTFRLEHLRRAVGKAAGEWERLRLSGTALHVQGVLKEGHNLDDWFRAMAEACVLSSYRFDTYLSDKKENVLETVEFTSDNPAHRQPAIDKGQVLGEAAVFTRHLVNEPANVLTPAELANRAAAAGRDYGFEVEVHEDAGIEELGMHAFMEVSRAAVHRPRLIVMRFRGNPDHPEDILGLVGKGLTYDSGGLSIKPNDGMLHMKCDMGGAGAVIGTMTALARLKPKVNVTAVVAACENMISGHSYRPGDIIQTMAGKSVYIGSTDAEGRLTLADALHYVIEHEKAAKVVDAATLTGAAIIALGHVSTAVVTNDSGFFQQLEQASEASGERIWQLPSFDEYQELIKAKAKGADLTNTGGRAAGTVTAGLFVGQFVQDKPWLHLDIAGTAFVDKPGAYGPEGATGAGARLLYHLAENLDRL